MTTGFNTEFRLGGRAYHVQTEDKGIAKAVIQSLIYVGGEILDSFKGDYSDLANASPFDEAMVLQRMQEQHKQIVADIKYGKYDFTPNDQALAEQFAFNDRPFLEAVIDHLRKDGDFEALELILQAPLSPKFSSPFEFSMEARLCISKFPVPGADVSVRFLSSIKKAYELLAGKTDANGKFGATIDMPPSQPGNCAILVACASEHGSDEIRALISA
jgi:hypothetical protein